MKKETTDDKHFLQIINSTPLVSIDLIVQNEKREVLLGKRVNRPAQGYWFVPGGIIRKNEKIESAIRRISLAELGIDISLRDAQLQGLFDHIYDDNYFGEDGVNTHYVVLAFACTVESDIEIVPDRQHSEMRWCPLDHLLRSKDVHQYTKTYFKCT